MATTGNATTP